MQVRLLSLAGLCALLEACGSGSQGPRYTVVDLGFPGNGPSNARLNNAGQVVMTYYDTEAPGRLRAVLWQNGVATDLGTQAGSPKEYGASSLNDAGTVVGFVSTAASPPYIGHAAVWRNGTANLLTNLPGDTYSTAADINDSGQIVGLSGQPSPDGFNDGPGRAVIWNGLAPTDLGVPGAISQAMAINRSGQIVGWSRATLPASYTAFLYQNGVVTRLPDNGGGISTANDINDQGQIVGQASRLIGSGDAAYPYARAAMWSNGQVIDLGDLGYGFSVATAINNRTEILGYAQRTEEGPHPFLYTNGRMYLLETLIANTGWTLQTATGINDSGQIIAWGSKEGLDGVRAILLTPE
jgi:probable HAF family extracellular repeat protein